jgi:hypothetical protein
MALCAALVSGCASGPKYSEMKGSIAEPDPEVGRIFFYRSGVVGAAVQPDILLNGTVVGEMVPKGFFYVDRPPGTYVASARTESEATVWVSLRAKQTQYVRGEISMGFMVGRPVLTLVDSASALSELQDLGYTGRSAPRPSATPAAPTLGGPAPRPAEGSATTLKELEGLLPGAQGEKK